MVWKIEGLFKHIHTYYIQNVAVAKVWQTAINSFGSTLRSYKYI